MKLDSKNLVTAALIAALYTALGMVFAPIGFGPVQLRVAEALCILVIYSETAVLGVTLGCLITNIFGVFTMQNILGPLDIIFGTAATFLAAVIGYKLRNIVVFSVPIAAILAPAIINGLVIGAELTYFLYGSGFSLPLFALQALLVAGGEVLSVGVLGVLLVKTVQKLSLTHLFS